MICPTAVGGCVDGAPPTTGRPCDRPHVHPLTDYAEIGDDELVRHARSGSRIAFRILVERHSPAVYRVALRMVGNHHDAEDLAQETFVGAWRALEGFRGNASFGTWLYRIVTRRALNRITREPKHMSLDDVAAAPADSDADPALHHQRQQNIDAVTAAVAGLPPAQRAAVVLHHFEGLSYREVASLTGATVPAVRSHLFRGRRTLATLLTTQADSLRHLEAAPDDRTSQLRPAASG